MKNSSLKELSTKALLLLLFSGVILLGGCKIQKVTSYWSAEPVQIDGQMTEWTGKPTSYLEKSGVQLGLRNNSENLYVLFRFSNQEWTRLISMGGVTLWLDNSGKEKKDFGIRYKGGPPPFDMQKSGLEGEGGFLDNLTPEQKERLRLKQESMAEQLTVIYKKSNQEIPIPTSGSSGPAVSFDSLQGVYTYEFKIPLQKSETFDYAINAQPGQKICLGLEWGELNLGDRENKKKQMGGGGMKPPGGKGGMGGGPPGKGGPGMKKPEKQELWIETQLASPPTE